MAGLISPSRMIYVGAVVLVVLAWPAHARAGWFVRDNQIAYRLSQQGHDRQALNYWDESAEGLYGRGTALMHLGKIREAERAFRESIEVAPHKTGFSDRLEMPAKLRPHFMASVWYNLGDSLYAQGELAGARQAWLKALGYEPGHAKARHNLEIVDRLLGSRERQPPPAPTGLNGKRKPGHAGQRSDAEQQQERQQQQRQHASSPLHMLGAPRHASGAGSRKRAKGGGAHTLAGAGQGPEKHAGRPTPHPSANVGRHAPDPEGNARHDERPMEASGMSSRQAVRELRMVNEGVSVFLRHRLGEKARGASADGGKPW